MAQLDQSPDQIAPHEPSTPGNDSLHSLSPANSSFQWPIQRSGPSSVSALLRAAAASLAHRFGSRTTARSASASAEGSPGGTRRPLTSSLTYSGIPFMRDAITGRLATKAWLTIIGRLSYHSDGTTTAAMV